MTSPVSAIEAIEEAIEHTTPGPWQTMQMGKRLNKDLDRLSVVGPSEVVHGLDGICEPDRFNDRSFGEDNSNMLYIATCSPDRMREVLALARQAEAMKREMAELRSALEMISAESKESNEPIGRSVFKALATCGEIADVALRARAIIGGGNAEE